MFFGLCLFSGLLLAQEGRSKGENAYIEISAEEEVKVVPDEIYLEITLDEKDTKGRIKLEEAEVKMKSLLKASGADLKNLSLTYASSDFYKRFLGKDIYALKRYELKATSAQEMSKLLKVLQESGFSNIYLSRVDYSKKEEIKSQLQAKALLKAKQKAAYLASSIGEKIGKAIIIQVQNSRNYPMQPVMLSARSNSSDEPERLPDTQYRTITIKEEILAKFEIK